jgi:hypothetical protein
MVETALSSAGHAATIKAQGAKVSDSPIASGSDMPQRINSPVFNVALSPPAIGAAGNESWLELFKEKKVLEEDLASLEAQVPAVWISPALKLGKDDLDFLREKIERRKKQYRKLLNEWSALAAVKGCSNKPS